MFNNCFADCFANERIIKMGCRSFLRFLTVVLLSWFQGAGSLRWTDTVGQEVRKCEGDSLTLAWDFTTDPGEEIGAISWNFQGRSFEIIANLPRQPFFVPSANFSNRVSFLAPAGIVLMGLVPQDEGTYSVEVESHVGGQSFSISNRSIHLDVIEPPQLEHHNSFLAQRVDAVVDPTTSIAHIQLSCGRFSSVGNPPVQVIWKTPWGSTEQSTSYGNGYFYLLLPDPVIEGQYRCGLDRAEPAALCLADSSLINFFSSRNLSVEQALNTLHNAQGSRQAEHWQLLQQVRRLRTKDRDNTNTMTQLESRKQQLTAALQAHPFDCRNPLLLTDVTATTTTTTTTPAPTTTTTTTATTTTTPSPTTTTTTTATTTTTPPPTTTTTTTATTTTTPAPTTTTTPTAVLTPAPSDPCVNGEATSLDNARRSVHNQVGGLCDNTLPEGWYQLYVNGADAQIPTFCVRSNHCGTNTPLWISLEGKALPQPYQEIEVNVCGSNLISDVASNPANTDPGCCDAPAQPIKIRNCGSFYIYYLKPTTCDFGAQSYCVTTNSP